ncbi:sulfurtransferase [Nocardioides alcanivorans]|uniref:sulfurtransferase n=1 Tax=Nocardioides alcanivorans TaxID=2897352 RepID=UPI001F220D94|nr:sulfurtransferase [Nocardioides alcanivorans]
MDPSPLISADELKEALPDVTVLDVRWRLGGPSGLPAYVEGHVPGSAYVDLDTALAAPPGDHGRHPLPDPEVFAAEMRAAGVRGVRPVVVLDDWSGLAAARCRWLLRHHGHDDVRLLDGGLAAWVAAGGGLETGRPVIEPGDFRAGPGRLPTVGATEVLDAARDGVLVDARAPERFRGEVEPVDPVAGHVPGAVNLPTTDNLAADGRFLAAPALRDRFASVGIRPGTTVAAYCGSGVTAAHELLALEVVGIEGALYPGSWSGWIIDPSRPVVTGA